MIYSLKGKVQELTPTYVVIDVSGVGYYVGISLQTSEKLTTNKDCFIYTKQIIRDDAHLLFGFYTLQEKEMFNLLVSVNGVGAVSALILLSSLSLEEIASGILNGNASLLQKVKGIGAKTAQRIIVDLKDKVTKFDVSATDISIHLDNKVKEESLSALEVLGISKKMAERHANQILKTNPSITVEDLVKQILKKL